MIRDRMKGGVMKRHLQGVWQVIVVGISNVRFVFIVSILSTACFLARVLDPSLSRIDIVVSSHASQQAVPLTLSSLLCSFYIPTRSSSFTLFLKKKTHTRLYSKPTTHINTHTHTHSCRDSTYKKLLHASC